MIPVLEELLQRLQALPTSSEQNTLHYGAAQHRSFANYRHTELQFPFWVTLYQFNPDYTERGWFAYGENIVSYRYRGNLPYSTQNGICLQYILKGRLKKMMMGYPVELYEGDCCLIDMNCVNAELPDNSETVLIRIDLRADFFLSDLFPADTPIHRFIREALGEHYTLNRYLLMRASENTNRIEQLLNALLTVQAAAGPGQLNLARGYVQELMAALETYATPELHSSGSTPKQDITFYEVDRYIRANLNTATIALLMDQFHYGRNYFSRLIRAKTGLSFAEYLRQCRIDEAKRLLAESKLSVQEISQRIGYENRTFFYRIFKEMVGLSPKEYRKQQD